MFKLRVIQAEFGDSLILDFGTKSDPHYILIDGGPGSTYKKFVKPELETIASAGRALDLVIASHVDNDHIVGLAAFTSDLRSSSSRYIDFGGVWHNSFDRAVDRSGNIRRGLDTLVAPHAQTMGAGGAALLGIKQGNKLRVDALALGVPLNDGFKNELVTSDTAPGVPLEFANVTFTVVGPTDDHLRALEDEWQTWLEDNEDVLTEADPATLAKLDESVPNLSSIMLLAEADGKTMLLTGDGRGDHLIDGLRTTGLLTGKTFHTDLLKMPHHGSDANVTRDFFDVVTADTYVISANGRYGNPDLATLIWLVEATRKQKRKIRIFVTNETASTKALVRDYPPKKYGYTLTIMDENAGSEVLTLVS